MDMKTIEKYHPIDDQRMHLEHLTWLARESLMRQPKSVGSDFAPLLLKEEKDTRHENSRS